MRSTEVVHSWEPWGPLTVRSQCGAIETLKHKATAGLVSCAVCSEGGNVLCAVPLFKLNPLTGFMVDLGVGPVIGVLERVPEGRGYAQVIYTDREPSRHKFSSRDGEVEFIDGGFRRAEWSAGTLVRPISEEDEMPDNPLVEAVGGAPVSKEEIREKVTALRAKAGARVTPEGKPKTGLAAKLAKAKAAPKEPKAEKVQSPCRCQCGTQTGGTFAPGHDARYYGWLKKIVSGDKDFKELPKVLQKEFKDVKGVKAALATSKH